MRHFLAEDVLNFEMQHTMKQYQVSLGEKGVILNRVVLFLEHTFEIVSVFRDMRPVMDEKDDRLIRLKNVADFFLNWTKEIFSNRSLSSKEKKLLPYVSPMS
ncbi:hypothetical protein ACF0H5_018373 [Mactra antiquata]